MAHYIVFYQWMIHIILMLGIEEILSDNTDYIKVKQTAVLSELFQYFIPVKSLNSLIKDKMTFLKMKSKQFNL